jgi:hypothetical protein
MIWLIILVVILFGVIGYAGYRIWYLAGALADAQEYIEELETTNTYMYSNIDAAYNSIKSIDRKQIFETDDEVGTTFQLFQEVIETLKGEFDGEKTQEEK